MQRLRAREFCTENSGASRQFASRVSATRAGKSCPEKLLRGRGLRTLIQPRPKAARFESCVSASSRQNRGT